MLEKAKSVGVDANITGLSNEDAAKQSEVVVVCLPHEYTKSTLEGIKDSFTNQVVITPVVPMVRDEETKSFLFEEPESGSSAAEI